MRRRLATPDADGNSGEGDDGGFADRFLYLATTLGGADRVDGNLTPRCAAALAAVLDALSKKAGPEDIGTFAATTAPAASISLPLDVGTSTDTIPAHLRRAVILRDRHCAAPGCFTPGSCCSAASIT
jgi:hypothetical protein